MDTTPKVVTRRKPAPGYTRPCDQCGTEFRVRACEARKAAQRGNNPPRFCSRKCQHQSYRGDGNPKWKGGKYMATSGYVYSYAPDHPFATDSGYVMEHRLVMERSIGRPMRAEEQVHHINHVRDDNRIENLQLMPDVTAHRELHAYYVTEPCGRCETPVQRSIAHRRRWQRAFCSRRCAAAVASEANASRISAKELS